MDLKPETIITMSIPLTVLWGIASTVGKSFLEGQRAKQRVVEAEQERDRAKAEGAKELASLHRAHAEQVMQELKTTVRHVEGKIGEIIPRLATAETALNAHTEELKTHRKAITESLPVIVTKIGELSMYQKPK